MKNSAPPFWQLKLSSKGQITLPTEVISRLGLVKGQDHLYLFLDDRIIRIVDFDQFKEILQGKAPEDVSPRVRKARRQGPRGDG